MSALPVIAITPGDPAGIGPEIALRAAWELRREAHALLLGDWHLLNALADRLQQNIRLERLEMEDLSRARSLCSTDTLLVADVPLFLPVRPGYPDSGNARAILAGLDLAIHHAQQKAVDAITTGPIQKSIINDAGIVFTGHTEYLAEKMQVEQVVMLLVGDIVTSTGRRTPLRVALATTHLPLKDVPDAIHADSLTTTLHILHQELQARFGIPHPRILVSGLNPHAGENGYLGTEENDIISPVLQSVQRQGILAEGPLPADTLFLPHYLEQADCFLVMYHDQGLPVLKYATFGRGVNVTLGLPVIRTSVDHGTALDIAAQGTGIADHSSMAEAIRLAAYMASQQRSRP